MAAITADTPIPSTESDTLSGEASDGILTPTSSPDRLSTVSVSVTPPPASQREEGSRARTAPTTTRGQTRDSSRSGTNGLSSFLRNMRLSEPNGISDLTDLAEAVDHVARGSDTPAATLSPSEQTQSPELGEPRQRRRSRLSASRTNTPTHDVRDEELPHDAFHSPEFQKAFADAKQLMANMSSVLSSSTLHTDSSATIHGLYHQAEELAQFQYPSSRTVGFVGDSGVGKSSLLNSLLDTKDLARTSNSGEACTCVVTEYHYHNEDKFALQLNLFSVDELNSQIKTMLQTYRLFHLHRDEIEEELDRRDAEAKAKVAIDTFHAMFRGRLTSDDFLINGPEEAVCETLAEWAVGARPLEVNTWQRELSLKTCTDALMVLSSEPPSRKEPAVWPYIKNIRVFSNSHILSRGLVLVDLPGLRDLNMARRIITERYLLQCDEIFAICNIGRAVTDKGVPEVLHLAKEARLSNVGIDIIAEEAIRDWQGPKAKIIKQHMNALVSDKRDLRGVKDDIDWYEEQSELSPEESVHCEQLRKRKKIIKRRQDSHNFELLSYLVRTRNGFVTEKVRKEHKALVNGEIKVFCVSNTHYWKYRDEPRDVSRPYLDLSGILDVRKHCISIVASSQRRTALQYMNDQIPAFLQQVDLWVQAGARTGDEERRLAICSTLDQVERKIRKELCSRRSATFSIAETFRQDFTEHIYGRRRITSWSQSAKNAARVWHGWAHPSYSAFCRNYGTYDTKAAQYHNWNEEAMNGIIGDLSTPWETLCSTLQEHWLALETLAKDVTKRAIERLEDDLDDVSDETDSLVLALETQERLLRNVLEQESEKFESNLALLRTDALSGIRSSLMGKAMEPAYTGCCLESGTGSHDRRKAIIDGAFGHQGLFNTLMNNFRDMFRQHADDAQEQIRAAVSQYLAVVERTFDLVRSENVARETEFDPEFRLRVEEATRESKGTVQEIRVAILV